MRGGAVKLLIECPALVQHAVQNIRRDPPRRETRHFGGQGEPLRGHGAEHLGGLDSDSRSARMPSKGQYLLHANMPNIRIAFVISQFGCDLYSLVLGSRMERGLSARLEILK